MDALGSSAHTAVVPVDGVISSSEAANAFDIQQNLEAAFEAPGSKGVMLEINSPGGSPVQSEYVFRAILDLKAQYPAKPVHAVIGDVDKWCILHCGSSRHYSCCTRIDYRIDRCSVIGFWLSRFDGKTRNRSSSRNIWRQQGHA